MTGFRLVVTLFFLCTFYQAGFCQTARNLKLVNQWNGSRTQASMGQKYNDVVGWYDQKKGKEYAILAGVDSLYFIDITDPKNLYVCDAEAGRSSSCINRDLEVYQTFCYAVADEGKASLQIFDLSTLPDSVSKIYDQDTLIANAHTLFREGERLYVCKASANNQLTPVVILDISNPRIPFKIGNLKSPVVSGKAVIDYVHDVFVKNDTAYCSCANSGIYMFDCTNAANCKYISAITTYPLSGYSHSSYMHSQKPVLYATDENNGSGIKVIDFSVFKQPDIPLVLNIGTDAIPHNTYVQNNILYVSAYHEGVVMFDISNATKPFEIARFDTYPQNAPNDHSGFKGCWSVFPWLPSAHFLASDTHNGLFLFKYESNLTVSEKVMNSINFYPNPVENNLFIDYPINLSCFCAVMDASGRIVHSVQMLNNSMSLAHLPEGFYLIKLTIGSEVFYKKIIKK